MFSARQKREISEAVQQVLCKTGHLELPDGEIEFSLHVCGASAMSWADIQNNGAVEIPGVNPHNEKLAAAQLPEAAKGEVGTGGNLMDIEPANYEIKCHSCESNLAFDITETPSKFRYGLVEVHPCGGCHDEPDTP